MAPGLIGNALLISAAVLLTGIWHAWIIAPSIFFTAISAIEFSVILGFFSGLDSVTAIRHTRPLRGRFHDVPMCLLYRYHATDVWV